MPYILNVLLPKKRNFKSAIRAIYGIGLIRATKLGSLLGLHPHSKIDVVPQHILNKLSRLIEKSFVIDFALKRNISLNINLLRKIRTVRGYCHLHGLPTRGQRTHTNASTANRLLKQNKASSNLNESRPFKLSSRFTVRRSKSFSNKARKPIKSLKKRKK